MADVHRAAIGCGDLVSVEAWRVQVRHSSAGPLRTFELTGHTHAVMDLIEHNGTSYLAELMVVLARVRFAALDDLARVTPP